MDVISCLLSYGCPDHVALDLGIRIRIVRIPDGHGHAWVIVHGRGLRAAEFGVYEDVIIVGVDPHHMRHGVAGLRDDGQGGEVLSLGELFDVGVEHGDPFVVEEGGLTKRKLLTSGR